jgi:hypothetical protein
MPALLGRERWPYRWGEKYERSRGEVNATAKGGADSTKVAETVLRCYR